MVDKVDIDTYPEYMLPWKCEHEKMADENFANDNATIDPWPGRGVVHDRS